MRRLAPDSATKERGAASVLLAVLLVALLGFTAIVVDVGLLYSERAQLQNGADASALAIAQECARTSAVNCQQSSPVAKELANKNALDGMSSIFSVQLAKEARTVVVTTSAKKTGGKENSVTLALASVLGFPTAEVKAKSSAVWGSPRAGRTPFPLAFSICQVRGKVDGGLQRLQSHGLKGAGANADCKNDMNTTVPGGFGWLPTDGTSCSAKVDLDAGSGWVASDPGINHPLACSAVLQKWADDITAGREVLAYLPVFDEVSGQGDQAKFHLVSFAVFRVTGWKLSGADTIPFAFQNLESTATGVTKATECSKDCRGIIGRFVTYASPAEGFSLGPVNSTGAIIVRLTL